MRREGSGNSRQNEVDKVAALGVLEAFLWSMERGSGYIRRARGSYGEGYEHAIIKGVGRYICVSLVYCICASDYG